MSDEIKLIPTPDLLNELNRRHKNIVVAMDSDPDSGADFQTSMSCESYDRAVTLVKYLEFRLYDDFKKEQGGG